MGDRADRGLVPLTGVALLGAVSGMRRTDVNRTDRAHYLLVTLAELVFTGWLRKWNLLGTRSECAPR